MDILTGKILKLNGWPDGKLIGLAKDAAEKLAAAGLSRDDILAQLQQVRQDPETHLSSPAFCELAGECMRLKDKPQKYADELRRQPLQYPVWGAEAIDRAAMDQMDMAMRLPVSAAGALMPDAHVGYGLPIGGVLAVENAVIPYAVGVDIACRMRLSIFHVDPAILEQKRGVFKQALMDQTRFGVGVEWEAKLRPDHEVLYDEAWQTTRLLKGLQATAYRQLGSSGSGNHFVEWGIFRLKEELYGLQPGTYLALLSHSGSRNVGFQIAEHYSKAAQQKLPGLDKSVRHLAWLPLASEEGQEYMLSMELAGRFASANHTIIHQRVSGFAGLEAALVIENHHNYAWKETLADGRQVIVHRKGATPAGRGVLGVIPGSMGDPGYLVRGLGNLLSLQSASHGAGRKMSRKAALDSISKSSREEYLHTRGITLLGGGMDESPQAYKSIHEVMEAQHDLVEIVGEFMPKIVRMANEPGQT
jgi:tRNA-splicing ligase RtcB